MSDLIQTYKRPRLPQGSRVCNCGHLRRFHPKGMACQSTVLVDGMSRFCDCHWFKPVRLRVGPGEERGPVVDLFGGLAGQPLPSGTRVPRVLPPSDEVPF